MSGVGESGHAPNSVPEVWRRRILGAFFLAAAALVVLDFVVHRQVYHSWEEIPAFYAIFGFLGLSGLILASKGLRRLVMRPEDYYSLVDYDEPGSEGEPDSEADNVSQNDAE